MGKKRYIDTEFWNDAWVGDLEPIDKMLFLYLLCNPQTNLCGIYQLSPVVMSAYTGIPKSEMAGRLERLKPKVIYMDGYVILVNGIKHQNFTNEKILSGIYRELANVPSHLTQRLKWPSGIEKKGPKPTDQVSMISDESSMTNEETSTLNIDLDLINTKSIPNGITSNDESPDPKKPIARKELFGQLVLALGFTLAVKPTDGRLRLLAVRRKNYSDAELLQAAKNLGADSYMQGDNKQGKRWGTIDYLLRNDENVDKYLTGQGGTSNGGKEKVDPNKYR